MSIIETVAPGRVIRRAGESVMSLSVSSDKTCLILTCYTCSMNDRRRVELRLPVARSREALAVMTAHDRDCHRPAA